MSSLDFRLELTEPAQNDYQDILHYTALTWGAQQVDFYEKILISALSLLKKNPNIGRCLKDIPVSYKAYPVGKHIIFYRTRPKNQLI
jgi:toxin ParE1/3/4